MLRYVLLGLLVVFLARALWRLFEGVVEGITGGSRGARVPQRGVEMVRDPVCGTFVVPHGAVTLLDGTQRIHFCSDRCRDKYRARTA